MAYLPRALALSLSQLRDPAILRVLGKSALITLAIFFLLGWGLSFGFEYALEQVGVEDGAGFGSLLAALATIIGAWLLFRIVALFVIQFFADEVVRAVEARHYPDHAAAARSLPLRKEISHGLRAAGRALLFNLLAMPVALLLLVTGIGTALLFWLVNAILLGRELQDMVWLRHRRDEAETEPMDSLSRFALGGVVAGLLAIPFINFLAPILGAASATHLVHRSRKERQLV